MPIVEGTSRHIQDTTKMKLALLFVGFCAAHMAQCTTTYTVCKTVDSVFDFEQANRNSSGFHGGNSGNRGPPGPKGEPGQVNHVAVNAILDERLQALQDQLACGGLVHNGYCYRLLFRSGGGVNYITAESLCHYHGGTLADVDSEQTYRAFFAYVKRSWFTMQTYVQVWLKMTSRGGIAYLSDGSRAPFTEWYRTYPRSGSSILRIGFEVPIEGPRSNDKGMFDVAGSHAAPIPLCKFSL